MYGMMDTRAQGDTSTVEGAGAFRRYGEQRGGRPYRLGGTCGRKWYARSWYGTAAANGYYLS